MKHVDEKRCILSADDIKFHAWSVLWAITRFYAERMCYGEPWHTPKELLELTKEELDTFYELVNIVCDKEINLEKLKGNVKLKHIGYFEILLQKLETKVI